MAELGGLVEGKLVLDVTAFSVLEVADTEDVFEDVAVEKVVGVAAGVLLTGDMDAGDETVGAALDEDEPTVTLLDSAVEVMTASGVTAEYAGPEELSATVGIGIPPDAVFA
ncbi:MAG: hypothetical protein Q9162_006499 [Coniocarpon cinnabarinum]